MVNMKCKITFRNTPLFGFQMTNRKGKKIPKKVLEATTLYTLQCNVQRWQRQQQGFEYTTNVLTKCNQFNYTPKT